MTDFNMPPGVSARDIPGQDDETGSPHPITDQWAGLANLMAPNAVVVGAALARSLESDLAAANDEITRLRAEVEALREDASKIPDILFDGWSVLQALAGPAKKRTSPENVSDVLDAVVNILKAAPAARAKEKE